MKKLHLIPDTIEVKAGKFLPGMRDSLQKVFCHGVNGLGVRLLATGQYRMSPVVQVLNLEMDGQCSRSVRRKLLALTERVGKGHCY